MTKKTSLPLLSFLTLYKKFKSFVIRHFLASTLKTIIWTILLGIISNIFSKKQEIGDNCHKFLPEFLRGMLGDLVKKKSNFVIFGLLLVFVYSITCYFDYSWEEELQIKGGHYAKNLLLEKFRQLPFEEKQTKKDEIAVLIEVDSANIGWYWEHLINHVYHSILSIILNLLFHQNNLSQMDSKSVFFSIFWLILINIFSYYFTRLVLRYENKYRKKLTYEQELRNKETNKATLIESMGLNDQYRSQQQQITKNNENFLLSFNHIRSLNKVIPSELLVTIFPFFLLLLSNNFVGANLFILWEIYENSAEVFKCLWDYSDYASSRERINKFLQLSEKNDNLTGTKINKNWEIKAIKFKNISFRYQGQSEWVLKNYTRSFFSKKTNYLLGENGTGKSTVLYLLLGVIKPQKGQVIVETTSGIVYNLHHDINLQHWRKKNIAYCSHDNLISEGSTGQKQLTNIDSILISKKEAQIFLFDEADNALDKENRQKVQSKIKDLSQNKLVIYIKH